MPTKRNNEVKEFAIGTKIEHNGKLYEVVEGKYCDNCSIANICSSNDIPSGNKFANALSRNQKLRIFGECSNINRADGTDIVFKEIPMTKSDNINHNIIQPLVEPDGTIKDLQIKAPYNYEIDMENSDLSKGIIKFKNKWLTLEQLYKLLKGNNYVPYSSSIKDCDDKLLALANFMDIAKYFNGDWEFDSEKAIHGYAITRHHNTTEYPEYNVIAVNAIIDIYYGNPVFKNEANAQYVIDNPNFRDILDKIFKV